MSGWCGPSSWCFWTFLRNYCLSLNPKCLQLTKENLLRPWSLLRFEWISFDEIYRREGASNLAPFKVPLGCLCQGWHHWTGKSWVFLLSATVHWHLSSNDSPCSFCQTFLIRWAEEKGSRVKMPIFTSWSWPLVDVRSQGHFLTSHDLQGGDNNYLHFLGFHVIVHIKYLGWFIQNRCKLFLFTLLWQLFYMLYESELILFIIRLFIVPFSFIHDL